MRILEEVVERYLRDLRPERSELMQEMEELAERDGIPIVHWETGRLLAVLCRVLDPVVLEVPPDQPRYPRSRIMDTSEGIRHAIQGELYDMLRRRRSVWAG